MTPNVCSNNIRQVSSYTWENMVVDWTIRQVWRDKDGVSFTAAINTWHCVSHTGWLCLSPCSTETCNIWRQFLDVKNWGGASQWLAIWDAAKYPTVHRRAPHYKVLSKLNCQQFWDSLPGVCVNPCVSESTTTRTASFSLVFIIIIYRWHVLSTYDTTVITVNTLNGLCHLLLFTHFTNGETGLVVLRNLPEVSSLTSGRAGNWTQEGWLSTLHHHRQHL